MAGGEDEPQQIVADVVVDRILERSGGALLIGFDLVAELVVLALDEHVAAQRGRCRDAWRWP